MEHTLPHLRRVGGTDRDRAVVLVLHGGQELSTAPVPARSLAYLRMLPFAKAVAREGDGVASYLLRNRFRGWNAPELHPVHDAQWALEEIRRVHGDAPVVLIGHSLGGRVALRVGGDPSVVGVCALAPWTVEGEPVEQLAGRSVLIAHGLRDRMTSPRLSYLFAERARRVTDRVARFDVRHGDHAMLRKARAWTRLATGFALGSLQTQPLDPLITNAWRQPAPDGLRVPL